MIGNSPSTCVALMTGVQGWHVCTTTTSCISISSDRVVGTEGDTIGAVGGGEDFCVWVVVETGMIEEVFGDLSSSDEVFCVNGGGC